MGKTKSNMIREKIPQDDAEKFMQFGKSFRALAEKIEQMSIDIYNGEYDPSQAHLLTIRATSTSKLFDKELREK